MKQEPDPSPSGVHPVGAFQLACNVAGVSVPNTEGEAASLAKVCILGAKTKADLLTKESPQPMARGHALELIAKLLQFPSWHVFNAFAKRFPGLSAVERSRHPDSARLLVALWTLSPEHEGLPEVRAVLDQQHRVLRAHDLAGASVRLVHRVMFSHQEPAKPLKLGYTADEVEDILRKELSWVPEHLVSLLLECHPVESGRLLDWPPLTEVTLGQLLRMHLARADVHEVALTGLDRAVVALQSALQAWADVVKGPTVVDFSGPRERKALAVSPQTTAACRELVERTFEPISDSSVPEAFVTQEHDSGFFGSLYSGSPEHIEEVDFRKLFRGHDFFDAKVFKRLAFREPLMGYQFTMWRLKHSYYSEESVGTFHNVEAVLHNERDELVAKVCLCLSIVQDNCRLYDFISHLDGPNRSDLLELASAAVHAAINDEFDEEEWRRLLFICDWEVRKQDRGQGLGVALLRQALKTAFRGLPGPECVAMRLAPLQSRTEELGFDDLGVLPDMDKASQALSAYWEKEVIDGHVLPRSVKHVLRIPRSQYFHGGASNAEAYGLGEMLMLAREYDGLPPYMV